MRRTGGFSLVELLVVVAIIALLAGLLVPSLGRVKELARLAVCGSNLRELHVGMESYTAANRACYAGPREWVLNNGYHHWINDEDHVTQGTLWPYVRKIEVYVCPSWPRVADYSPHNHATDLGADHQYDYTPGEDRLVRSFVVNWNIGKKTNNGQGLVHKTQIRRPQDLGLYTEESPWFVYRDGIQWSGYIMNDACLVADNFPTKGGLQDCLGDFHLPPLGKWAGGFVQLVMLDGHIERGICSQTLDLLRQPDAPDSN